MCILLESERCVKVIFLMKFVFRKPFVCLWKVVLFLENIYLGYPHLRFAVFYRFSRNIYIENGKKWKKSAWKRHEMPKTQKTQQKEITVTQSFIRIEEKETVWKLNKPMMEYLALKKANFKRWSFIRFVARVRSMHAKIYFWRNSAWAIFQK